MTTTINDIDGLYETLQNPRHGTLGAYSNHGCRCARCRGAYADYHRARTARKRQETR